VIAIVDYKAGNLTSVRLALEHLGVEATITQNPAEILAADRVIFPGVGAAGSAVANVDELGLREPLKAVVAKGTPFLGICLGMQILFAHSEEDGGVDCMGLVPGEVKMFRPSDPLCKIPQMGWNTVELQKAHPLFGGIEDESEFYFVHSFYAMPSDSAYTLAETEYADVRFTSVVGKDNLIATQFHPERSGRIGLKFLENFSNWDGTC
jgi:imidazole glycerol-phosphate synthase subunit HisH